MTIEHSDIKNIANLARLKVTDTEMDLYTNNLNRILDLVETMSSINTDDVQPLAHPQDMAMRLRTDQVTAEDERDELLKAAPETSEGLFLVPKVIE